MESHEGYHTELGNGLSLLQNYVEHTSELSL